MNVESVSVEMFKIWADSQKEILATLAGEMKSLSVGQVETNKQIQQMTVLLREDINTTKESLNQHIIEYNFFIKESGNKFLKIEETQGLIHKTLDSREGVYKAAKSIKWALGLLATGILAASGAGIYKYFTG